MNICNHALSSEGNVVEEFEKIILNTSKTSLTIFEYELEIPRIVASQRNRINPQHETKMDYLRRYVFIPSLDYPIGDFKSRFQDNQTI